MVTEQRLAALWRFKSRSFCGNVNLLHSVVAVVESFVGRCQEA